MRVLSLDPGAERMGWASLLREDGKLHYHMSGVFHIPRGNMRPQEYRIELVNSLSAWVPTLIDLTEPDEVVNEIVPSVGGGNFAAAGQSYLANTAITVVQTIASLAGIPIVQIGANTMQKRIAVGRKSRKITKVQVRNGVIQLLPELADRKSDWVKIFEEPDAIAIGATELGFKN